MEIDHEMFSTVILFFPLFSRAVVSFWKTVHKYWSTAWSTKPAQEKVWLGKLTALDMILMGWISRKNSAQSIKSNEDSNQHASPRSLIRVFIVRMEKHYILGYAPN